MVVSKTNMLLVLLYLPLQQVCCLAVKLCLLLVQHLPAVSSIAHQLHGTAHCILCLLSDLCGFLSSGGYLLLCLESSKPVSANLQNRLSDQQKLQHSVLDRITHSCQGSAPRQAFQFGGHLVRHGKPTLFCSSPRLVQGSLPPVQLCLARTQLSMRPQKLSLLSGNLFSEFAPFLYGRDTSLSLHKDIL